jgi:hypothetical protein
MAVMVALVVAGIVFVLSVGMLALVEHEKSYYLQQEAESRAYLAAQSGLWYFRTEAESFAATPSPSASEFALPDAIWTQTFVIQYSPSPMEVPAVSVSRGPSPSGIVSSTGIVSRGPLHVTRTLTVRNLDFSHVQDSTQ